MAVWRRRLPISNVPIGKPRVRATKALRERISKLRANDDGMDDGMRLQNYLRLVVIVEALRPDRIGRADTDKIAEKLVEQQIAVPGVVHQAVVGHRA